MTDHVGSYNGLSFGRGTDYIIRRLKLHGRQTAILTPDLPRYHGGLVGASYEAPRLVEVDFSVRASSQSDLMEKLDDFFAAFEPRVDDELPLVFGLPGQDDRRIVCRPVAADPELMVEQFVSGEVLVPVLLSASDPVIYADVLASLTLDPFESADGFSWDAVWPISWGTGGSGAGSILTLGGKWESWPTFTIDGPSSGTLTNPRIEYVTGGQALELTANGGVSLTAGQQLIIRSHPKERSIAFDTGASRYGKLSAGSEWFALQPGSNELRFRASGTTTGATVTVEARSAWI